MEYSTKDFDNQISNDTSRESLLYSSTNPNFSGVLSFMRRRYIRLPQKGQADAVVWGIPFDSATSCRPGSRFGPRAIRQASSILACNDPDYPFGFSIFQSLAVVDCGDLDYYYGEPQLARNIIYERAKVIHEKCGYLLTLGGDHSILYSLLQATASKWGPVALVQFDAHQDTWSSSSSGEGIDHGTCVKEACDMGFVDPQGSIQVGIRTHAPEDMGIEIIDARKLMQLSPLETARKIAQRVGNRPVYCSFDIDCLDPAYAPGTGTPVCGGISTAYALEVLHGLTNLNIVSSDIVEVSPSYDSSEITALIGATIGVYFLGLYAQRLRAGNN